MSRTHRLFALCALLMFTICACHQTDYETPLSDNVRLPIAQPGQSSGAIRFVTARRAVDNADAARYSETASDSATLGRITFALGDIHYLAYDHLVLTLRENSAIPPKTIANVIVALFNGKTASHSSVGEDQKTVTVYIDGDTWQNENTLVLFGLNFVSDARLGSSTDSTLSYALPAINTWERADELPSLAYQWYLPPEKRTVRSLPFMTRLKNFFTFKIDPVNISPQWVSLVLNSARPLPVFEDVPETRKDRLAVQARIEAQDISSQMALTSVAIWYEIDFYMPDSDVARQTQWHLVFSKIGAGSLWVNGHHCKSFKDAPGCHVAELCPKSIIYGGRNRINFLLIPSTRGAVLDAAELYPGMPPVEKTVKP